MYKISDFVDPKLLENAEQALMQKMEQAEAVKPVGNRIPFALLRFFANYINYNYVFGPGAIFLAHQISLSGEFTDQSEDINVLSDRCMHVASFFFDATRDEFDDTSTPHRDTHRSLAQAFIYGLKEYYKVNDRDMNSLFVNSWLPRLHEIVLSGFGKNRPVSNYELFVGMGFHLASEAYASEEFTVIDNYFQIQQKQLYEFLKKTKVKIAGAQHDCYKWIEIHSSFGASVEEQHAQHAIEGVNCAMEFTSLKKKDDAKKAIEEGVSRFIEQWNLFVKWS